MGSGLSSIEFPENQISVDYYGMNYLAQNDANLKHINHINVKVLSSYSLTKAFEGCTSLATVDGISGVTNSNCNYALSGMFNNCRSLVDVGDLDITANGSSVCKCMFNNCTSLSAVRGKLFVRGGTSLERGFSNCVGLKDASQLSVRVESSSSGRYLFDGCSNLESMPVFILDP